MTMTSSRMVLTVALTILALEQSATQRPPPKAPGGGGGSSSSCKCAVDGSDYKYTEAVEGFTRTVVTSWCPNHYYDDANLNPNSAVTTGESTITMPAMPMLEGSTDLSATGGGVGVLFNGAMIYSAFAGTVSLTGYDSSATKLEGDTFDKCGCHSSSKDRASYHCHIRDIYTPRHPPPAFGPRE